LDSNIKLIIYAPNIHQGGGKSLLSALLKAANEEVHIFADHRMAQCVHESSIAQIRYIRPTLLRRFLGELQLRKLAKNGDVILCMGNLPPIFQLQGETILFLQNRYLVDNVSLRGFSLKVMARIFLERIWLKIWSRNVDRYIVQTSSMKCLLQNKLGESCPISVKPFLNDVYGFQRRFDNSDCSSDKIYDLIYVASGEPHKNHMHLIEAWVLLAKDGHFPSLCLTVDGSDFPVLCDWIKSRSDEFGLNLTNIGNIPHNEMLQLYKKCRAAIYPSMLESFGIPLVEARQAGIPILASELDYVRDLLDPEETFDPNSTISIARSVKRYLGLSEQHLKIVNASYFIDFLIEGSV
jgi:glycosyltransferase involved in cell wall biosynthesis